MREDDHAFWRIDVFHRLFDGSGRTGPGTGSTRLRVGLGAGAFAYPDVAALALSGRWRPAKGVLRRDGPVRHADRGGNGDEEAEGWHRRMPGQPARHDPDREAGGIDRPGVRRTRS